jgi:hypothetical protein
MNNRGLGRTMVRLPADTQAAKPQIILSINYVLLFTYATILTVRAFTKASTRALYSK